MQQMKGVSISQGLAVGKIVVLTSAAAPEAQAGTPEEELERFQRAQQQAVRDLGALYEKARAELGEAEAEIFSVHQLMAEDEDFADLITAAIAGGAEASEAVRQAGEQCAAMFSSMDDAYMRERAADVQDVAARIRRILRGEAETTLTGPCLIAAEELTPSQTVQFPRAFVQGFLTARGAANSHTGILARTLGVPAVSQLPVDAQLQGRTAILNGDEGMLILDPDEDQLRAAEAGIRARQAQREALQQLAKLPSVTKDGHAIRLYANLAGTDDLPLLQQSGAEGVGLLRSEFLYLGRSSYPTEDELFASYRQLVQAMDGREIIIRTLDIGADKKADYFDLPPEDNPALGLRAIRLCLTRPALLQTQLCAILRASAFGNVGVMFPMVTSVWEVREAKKYCEEVKRDLKAEGIPFAEDVQVGIMIETPAAAIMSDRLAKEVDFFSCGTNDLTQYTLACDRQNNDLGRFYDPHNPAVLRLLKMVTENAHKNGIWVGICGELGADLTLTETFLAIGVDELSVSPRAVLPLRNAVRMTDTRESAPRLLAAIDAEFPETL